MHKSSKTAAMLYSPVKNGAHNGVHTNEPYSVDMHVTPEQAQQWLANNHANRDLRPRVVKKYARAMSTGQWMWTPEGISLAPSGRILQGQHRLHAIVLSGVTVYMRVNFNIPECTYAVFDCVEGRPLRDRVGCSKDVQKITKAMAKGLGRGPYYRWTDTDEDDFFYAHREAIEWSYEIAKTTQKGLRRPHIAAVIARARYSVDHDLLKRFADVVINGVKNLDVVSPGDRTACSLRDLILRMKSGPGGTAGSKLYGQVERALKAFEKNKELKAEIRPVKIEQYPLPTDEVPVESPHTTELD